MIIKDVFFEENKIWDWDNSFKDQIDAELTWGDEFSDDESDEEDESTPQDENNTQIDGEIGNMSQGGISNTTCGRLKIPPAWLRDYESGEVLRGQEETGHMAYMEIEDTNDPMYFEDAIKEEKWRKAMNKEISSIEKKRLRA